MTLTYKLELEDWLAFNRFYRQNTPVVQKQMRMTTIVFTLLLTMGIFSTLVVLQKRVEAEALISSLIGGALLYFMITRSSETSADKSARQIYESGQNKTLRELVTLTIHPNYIETISALSESKMKWPLVEKIAATADYIFIYISANNALIIPKRTFETEDQRQQCIKLLQQYHAVVYA